MESDSVAVAIKVVGLQLVFIATALGLSVVVGFSQQLLNCFARGLLAGWLRLEQESQLMRLVDSDF